ncbi:MAG: flagellar motor protein MotB [Alphaproteobacteria bacterium]|nr:flagellar motor protein MotB [Alphaproteobacteria bacterium]
MAKQNDEKQPIIIIKKVKKVSGGHHGGAWKVAYADFVTAMMAFFLLLWLLNVTTDEQKELISSYFAPADPRISQSTSGSGGVMGGTSMSPKGAMTSDTQPIVTAENPPAEGVGQEQGQDSDQDQASQTGEDQVAKEMDKSDDKAFDKVQTQIKQAIQQDPDLKALSQNLVMDMTPEGLRIQIVDQQGKPMFALGSATPLPEALKLFAVVTKVITGLPNKISIRGHTDSIPYGKDAAYTNWELSSDRANASRRAMLDDGLKITRVNNVQGIADREPLVKDDPKSARNRRISIILLKQSVTRKKEAEESGVKPEQNAGTQPKKMPQGHAKPARPEPRKREPGVIYFP